MFTLRHVRLKLNLLSTIAVKKFGIENPQYRSVVTLHKENYKVGTSNESGLSDSVLGSSSQNSQGPSMSRNDSVAKKRKANNGASSGAHVKKEREDL